MNERRIARLQELVKQRVAQVVAYELSDPKLGMVTITRVEIDRELTVAKVYWSSMADLGQRRTQARILDKAAGFVQGEVAKVLTTRTVPRIKFAFDERIEGALRMQNLLDDLRAQREARERTAGEEVSDAAQPDSDSDRDPPD